MAFAARLRIVSLLTTVFILAAGVALGETIDLPDATGPAGIHLRTQSASAVDLTVSLDSFGLEPVDLLGGNQVRVTLSGALLPNDAGAPDLAGIGRFIAIPRGARAVLEIVSARTERRTGVEVAPAPVIPKETEDGPLVMIPNAEIYNRDAFYPSSPVVLSAPAKIRGVDFVTVGVTPFQYNPVTKELLVYSDLEIRVRFEGGDGTFGEPRFRNRYWEPILQSQLLNYASLPTFDFDRPSTGRDGFDYLIVCPDDPDFIAWADTLKQWRQLEGIRTGVFTTTDIGGESASVIEAWLNNAYQTWDPAPAAFLILGDYPQGTPGITSPIWNSYCVSDNMYADVDGDNLPDMVHARITARNASELQTMIGKMLDYERHPVTDPGYYDHPVIAGGWQTERWFILCDEVVFGHQANALGKHPTREYAIYQGTPGTLWSTATNTSTVVSYFGPNGLGYIPATPEHLTDWGGNATRINNDLNTGSYMLMHRDHGYEAGWGEPSYTTSNLSGLHNEMLPFVFSMNCLTGKYNYSSDSFTEVFHRMAQGAVGLIAASEVSYSFVNDCLVWGLFDTMWPDFMPDYGPYEPETGFVTDLRPAFGMCSGKYFLQASSWPYNTTDKLVTYHLFHHHGDAFQTLYSEVPQAMTVDHGDVCLLGVTTFPVTAEPGAVIALTVDGEIVGTAEATGMPQEIPILPQTQPGDLRITITKANYYRYDQIVPIIPPEGPYLVYDSCGVDDEVGDGDGVLDAGETVDLHLTLENVGVEPTTGVSAILSSEDPLVEILAGEQGFPDIPAGGLGACTDPYQIRVSGAVTDGAILAFHLLAQGNEGSWETNFNLPVQAPVLMAGGVEVDDSAGNGDGMADPGETVSVGFGLYNEGHSDLGAVTGLLTCSHPGVAVVDAQADGAGVPMGGSGTVGPFAIEVTPLCPDPTSITLVLQLTNDSGFAAEMEFLLDIGAWFDDVENDRGWTLGADGDDAATGQWVRVDPVGTDYNGTPCQPEDDHTPGLGTICFVTGQGGVGGAAGDADVDGGKTTLLTPVFPLAEASSATVSYWRWYTNDLGNNPSEDWWDVEVTSGGLTWSSLEHTQASANEWTFHSFDLGSVIDFTNQVRLRFVAADETNGSLVEAALDDFILDASFAPSTGVPDGGVPSRDALISIGPNPARLRTSVSFQLTGRSTVRMELYDVSGRRVRDLVSGTVDSGEHTVVFDGKDGAGRPLASGIYFLRFQTPQVLQVRQLTLLK